MPDECSELKQEADKAADAYFPVVTRWALTGANDESLRKEAQSLAGAFRRSIKWLIECYERARRSIRARHLKNAIEMQQIVEKDIATLKRYAPDQDKT